MSSGRTELDNGGCREGQIPRSSASLIPRCLQSSGVFDCLCVQAFPDINPQIFYDLVYSTATILWKYDIPNGSLYQLRIVNPEKVIKCLQFSV